MLEDDAPATTGEVRISTCGFTSSTCFDWPITQAGTYSPAQHLVIRSRADGEIFMSIRDDWDQAFHD